MTVLQVLQNAALTLGIQQPTLVYGGSSRDQLELGRVANEAADAIFRVHDWQTLAEVATITGDGSTEAFDLPSNYARMLKKGNLWSSSLETAFTPYPDWDTWLELDVQAFDFVINAWTLYGNQIHIKPAIGDGVTVKYFYIKNTKVIDASQNEKTTFTADTDRINIGNDYTAFNRLLELGCIWQWKRNKRQPYAEELADYEELKGSLATPDKGARIIRMGRPRYPWNVRLAYPQNIRP